MYALYRKYPGAKATRFEFQREVHLFGCNKGLIPKMLESVIKHGQEEPWDWHVRPEEVLRKLDFEDGSALVINLKPNNAERNLSLFEIDDIWGRSYSEWTPIMLRLRGLFIDEDPAKYDGNDFTRQHKEISDPIFSILYLNGSIEGGKLTGRWTAPRASPTNSALLWPDTYRYFTREANKVLDRAT